MKTGDIVLTPGESGPYCGKQGLVTGIKGNTASVQVKNWSLLYEKADLRVVGRIKTGKRYHVSFTKPSKEFQQFEIVIGDYIKTVDAEMSNSCYQLGDLRKAVWAKWQEST